MTRKLPLNPLTSWPTPVGKMSSIELAANDLWKSAEIHAETGDGTSPVWLLDGALAYAFDLVEDVRRRHKLDLASTVVDMLPFVTYAGMRHEDPKRLRYILQLVTYAIEQDELRESRAMFKAMPRDQRDAIVTYLTEASS
jgi:hypothetical protein